MRFDAAIKASQGRRRYQEDTAMFWPGGLDALVPPIAGTPKDGELLALLADGMGGHAGGSLASRAACEAFLLAYAASKDPALERLTISLEAANDAIAAKVAGNRRLSGMGSTLVGAAFADGGLTWISVGDSPLFLWRNGELVTVNEDHSLAPLIDRMAREGQLTWAEAQADPQRHFLRSAVTGGEIELIDLAERQLPLKAGDVIVLSSDGIHTLEPEAITGIVAELASGPAEMIAKALVARVDRAGDDHQDNTTVVVVRVVA